jgi:hypothetical protein
LSHAVSPTPTHLDDSRRPLRHAIYLVLAVLSLGSIVGRILAVNSVDMIRLEAQLKKEGRPQWQKQRPFLSSNDRSRWCTVRALVEHGTYAIDRVVAEPNWDTIDAVKHDGYGHEAPLPYEGKLYSSKPPLFATLMAGPYWVLHRVTGHTLGTHPYELGRTLVILFNVVPLAYFYWLMARLIERFARSDWAAVLAMAATTWGTFLGTFAVVINNHLPAAVCAAAALEAAVRIGFDGDRRPRRFYLAGFAAALAATFDLPALAMLALLAVVLWRIAPRETLRGFVPAVVVVAAAFFGTNYISHSTPIPPYAHRQPGDNWYSYQFIRDGKVRDSYWNNRESRSPIDQGEPSPAVYALHVLVGHHGIFSLTPVWLLSVAGLLLAARSSDPRLRRLAGCIALVSVVCLAFYLSRPVGDRNYSGMSSGFRWVFWLAPPWIIALVPAADALARSRLGRGLGYTLLGLSTLSAAYPTWNPWTHPWLLNLLQHVGLVELGIR